MPVIFDVKAGKVGNSIKITLPRPVTEGLEIKPGDILQVTVSDHKMEVKKKG